MNEHADISVQGLFDRMEITLIVNEIDNAVDAKDWERCRGYFTDEIYADFTPLAGGSPGNIPADDLVGAWATNLYADKLSHHMRSNHRVTIDGDRAEGFSKGYALSILHRPTGSGQWEVWGNYTHTLERTDEGWKCSGMTFVATHARGNEAARATIIWNSSDAHGPRHEGTRNRHPGCFEQALRYRRRHGGLNGTQSRYEFLQIFAGPRGR